MTPAVCQEMDEQMAHNPHEAHLVKDLYRLQSVLETKMPVELALESALLEKEETQAKLFAKGLECIELEETLAKMQLQQRLAEKTFSKRTDGYNTAMQSALHDAAEREKRSVQAFRLNQVADLLDQPKEVQTDYELMEQYFADLEHAKEQGARAAQAARRLTGVDLLRLKVRAALEQ